MGTCTSSMGETVNTIRRSLRIPRNQNTQASDASPSSAAGVAEQSSSRPTPTGVPPKSVVSTDSFEATFKLHEILGTGAFSIVRAAVHKGTNEKVAVKIINKAGLPAEDERDLKQEVAVLKKMDHANIVQLVNFYDEKDQYMIVMEYLEGGELFDRIVKKSVYNEKEARDLVFILLSAVKYMHDRNVVHRDLKPENLLLKSHSDDADVKIADFGFAVITEGMTLSEQCGTPGYVAPEILGHKKYGKAVDMWSVGVIAYILLGGYPPFHDDNQKQLFRKIQAAKYEFHPDFWGAVSDDAKDLISHLLVLDVEKRLTADQALNHSWIKASDQVLVAHTLESSLGELKKYQANKKFKKVANTIIATQKFKTLIGNMKDSKNKIDEEDDNQIEEDGMGDSAKAVVSTDSFEATFKLHEILGTGAFSIVQAAVHNVTNEKVAVKIINKAGLPAEDERDLKQEVEVLKKMDHANIVQLVNFYDEKDQYMIVMEYLEGGELFDRIVKKTFYNEKEARDLVFILLSAVKYMHDRNVVHRDLKPENLLLKSHSDDADVKIADFGFAVITEGMTLSEQCGTPGYVAPEILGHKKYGKPVDMWSVGVIAYILLGGYPPFHDDNQKQLFRKIQAAKYEFHPEFWGAVSDDAKDLISHLLVLDVEQRLTADQALNHSWIKASDQVLVAHTLESSLGELKKYQANKKFKKVANTIIATQKFKTLIGNMKDSKNKTDEEDDNQIDEDGMEDSAKETAEENTATVESKTESTAT